MPKLQRFEGALADDVVFRYESGESVGAISLSLHCSWYKVKNTILYAGKCLRTGSEAKRFCKPKARTPDPTPKQIAERAAAIRAGWSKGELESRMEIRPVPFKVPTTKLLGSERRGNFGYYELQAESAAQ